MWTGLLLSLKSLWWLVTVMWVAVVVVLVVVVLVVIVLVVVVDSR